MPKPNAVLKRAFNRSLTLLGTNEPLPSSIKIAEKLGVSRTTVRSVLRLMEDKGLIDEGRPTRRALRAPIERDYFEESETSSAADIIERSFMHRVLRDGAEAGDQFSELELARDAGVSTTVVREYLIGFSRFGLIEKRRNGQWRFKGFDRRFALELCDVREMFELRSAKIFAGLPDGDAAWTALEAIRLDHEELLARPERHASRFSVLDERFHRLVHEASGNRFVVDFYDVIAMIFHYHYRWDKADEADRNKAALIEHLDYIGALRKRSVSETEFYCRKHLASARDTLLRSIP